MSGDAADGSMELREEMQALVAMSRSMLESARRGEWDAVVAQQARRHDALFRVFGSIPEFASSAAVQSIRDILDSDRELAELLEGGRRELGDELRRLGGRHRVNRAYHGHDPL
jgi:plasmid stabilization system protein ParE